MKEKVTASPKLVAQQTHPTTIATRPMPLDRLLDNWVTAGEITPEQATRLRDPPLLVEVPRPRAPEPPGPPPAVEALGYVGGLVLAVASIVLGAVYGEDLSSAARLLLLGAAATALLVGGLLVSPRLGDAAVRIRTVLWAAATLTIAGFLAVLGSGVLGWGGVEVALATAAGTTLVAGTLVWASVKARRRDPARSKRD